MTTVFTESLCCTACDFDFPDPDIHDSIFTSHFTMMRSMLFSGVKKPDYTTGKLEYPQDYTGLMMNYSRNYSFVPTYN
jgi:hypothetical protein